jgi:hypothetical protein
MKFRFAPALILGLAACAPKSETPPAATPQVVAITTKDFAFSAPDTIAPGFTTFRVTNEGPQDHHVILGRLEQGKTLQDLMAYMKENPNAEPPFLTWRGAAGALAAGQTVDGATVDLPAGNYVLMCFVLDPADHMPHLLKGMMREIVVAGTPVNAAAPMAHAEIRLKDFAFEAPQLTAGTHVFHVVNDGPQTHEIQLIRLNEGASVQDFMAALAPDAKSPPPGVMMGGPGAYSVGLDAYWTTTLTPGHYIFVCFVPDVASGMPHLMKGMVHEFTIAAN